MASRSSRSRNSTWTLMMGVERWNASIWVLWTTMVTAGLVVMSAAGGAGACPGVKWKGGKQTVECRQRGLITLPSNIDPQTQVLDLSGSNLQTLPREAFSRANLLNLQKIYLASCRIGQVDPTALRGLTNLIELDISDNLLTDVPSEALRDAVSLRELRLSSNPIQKIEQGAFDQAPGLVKLDLSDCQIETLAAGAFDGLDQLSHLRLGGNRLQELRPDVVSSLPSRLHGLELQNNPWICDCRLRYLREWLQQHNVPSPATAACALPERLAGRALIELQVDDFACAPQVIPFPAAPLLAGGGHPHLHVEASAGENATLTCRMSGVPSPEITWLWRGRPMANGSIPGEPEALPVGETAEGAGYPSDETRTVIILDEGKYEKTSYLILSPARETDSGEFVCVAANAAGLARVNLTLRVDVQAPVVGGLGGAQIAGLGAGLFILLAAVVAILLLMLIRTRSSANSGGSSANNKLEDSNGKGSGQRPAVLLGTNNHAGNQGPSIMSGMSAAKSPTLSALEYGQIAFVNPQSPNRVVVVTTAATTSGLSDRPDLIHDARTSSDHNYGGYDLGPPGPKYSTLNRRYHTHGLSADRDILAATSAGDYQSAQTDSFYPSALWDHILNPTSEEDTSDGANNNLTIDQGSSSRSSSGQHIGSPIHLPHVPLTVMDRSGLPQIYVPYSSGQIIQNPRDLLPGSYADRESEAGESAVSVDSYSLPCRIPVQQQQQQGQEEAVCGPNYVPYPPDYGLPRTSPPPTLPKPSSQHLAAMAMAAGAAMEQQQPPAPVDDPSIHHHHSHHQQQQQQQTHNSSSSCYGSKANSSAESSPIATVSNPKGPRFWQQRPGTNNGKRSHHHFARDSPDEGYQEECATDV